MGTKWGFYYPKVGETFASDSAFALSMMYSNDATYTTGDGLPAQVTPERLQSFGIMGDMVTAVMLATLPMVATGLVVCVLVGNEFVRVW